MASVRKQSRRAVNGRYKLSWQAAGGDWIGVEASAIDLSGTGIRVTSPKSITSGGKVRIEACDGHLKGEAIVRHAEPHGNLFTIGLEFCEGVQRTVAGAAASVPPNPDYYELLQISPTADQETVRRVYRIMAARFHPDNPETGNLEKFLAMEAAYKTLSDPNLREQYDLDRENRGKGPDPIFELKDFVVGVEGETNRRLGVLALLYNQRRADPEHPGISLLDLEKRMAFPREHLEFTMWYLKARSFVIPAENSAYTLTADGVDHLESSVTENSLVNRLLNEDDGVPGSRTHKNEHVWERAKVHLVAAPVSTRN